MILKVYIWKTLASKIFCRAVYVLKYDGNGSNLRFVSASYIELQGGFEVEAGASFEADVYECNMVNH